MTPELTIFVRLLDLELPLQKPLLTVEAVEAGNGVFELVRHRACQTCLGYPYIGQRLLADHQCVLGETIRFFLRKEKAINRTRLQHCTAPLATAAVSV